MKQEEYNTYITTIRTWLLDNGFIHDEHFISGESWSRDFGFHNELSVVLDNSSQYVYVQCKEDREIVTLYNLDRQGMLSIEYLNQLIKTIYWNGKEN